MSNYRVLSVDEKNRMLMILNRMLARHVVTHPCPLNADAYGRYVEATLADMPRRAWHAMRNWWLSVDEPPPFKSQEFIGIPTIMPLGHVMHMQINKEALEENKYPLFRMDKVSEPLDINQVLWGEERSDFLDWAYMAVKITARSLRTQHTFDALINMASTVGQLHRMCPDLVRYTYDMTQEALAKQERRSPLPHDWMRVDRRNIHDMLDHLALCHLLPEVPGLESFKHHVNVTQWMFDYSTSGCANYQSAPEAPTRKLLSVYDIGSDNFTIK
jgi:hypothetical protein